jgi:hypothetical protein
MLFGVGLVLFCQSHAGKARQICVPKAWQL